MNIILCSDCGKLMSRYTTQCVRCTRANLEFYNDPNSAELQKRIKQITGRKTLSRPLLRALIMLIAAVVVTLGYWQFDRLLGQQIAAKAPVQHPVQTAGTSAAITH
jgi:predicted ATP-dependent serine protease